MAQVNTLKEIGYPINQDLDCCVDTKILKQEAIKWIKELEKCSREDGSCKHDNDDHLFFGEREKGDSLSQNECIALKDWIKHFFNINEEDLK